MMMEPTKKPEKKKKKAKRFQPEQVEMLELQAINQGEVKTKVMMKPRKKIRGQLEQVL